MSPVEHILAEMKELYGNQFDKQWGGRELKDMVPFWERKLAGFTADELRRGYKALSGLKFPPTLPEFMQLCRPPVDPVKAYYEAVKGLQERRFGRMGEWSHPAIFWAASKMAFDLLNQTHPQVKARFEKALDDEFSRTSWPEIPAVSAALPPPKVDREKAKADAEAALERVGASGAVRKVKFSRGNGDWIVNNLERIGKGWNPLPGVRKCIMDGAGALGIAVPEGVLHEARSKNL